MGIHIIHKQKVNLTISRAADSFTIQNRISRILKDELPKDLEPLFNKLSPNGKSLRIEKLSIDIGTISRENLDSEFRDRLIEQLTSKLEILAAGNKDTLITEVSEEQSLVDTLLYFLEHGYLPWYSRVKDFHIWEKGMLHSFSAGEWKKIIQALKKQIKVNDTPVKRLTLQFSEAFLQTFWMSIHETSLGNWNKISDNFIYMLQSVKADLAVMPSGSQSRFYHSAITITLRANNEEELIFEFITSILLRLDLFRLQSEEIIPATLEKPTSLPSSVRKKLLLKIKTLEEKISSEAMLFALKKLHQSIAESLADTVDHKKPHDLKTDKKPERNELRPDEDNKVEKIEPLPVEDKIAEKTEQLSVKNKIAEKTEPLSVKDKIAEKTELFPEKDKIADKKEPQFDEFIKAKKKEPLQDEDGIFCENCGIVILHPFLQMFFTELGFFETSFFKDEWSRLRAVFLLHYLATGETSAIETRLILPKLLSATDFDEPLPFEIDLSEIEKESCNTLLKSVLNYWEPLRTTSIEGLQQTFFQREGKLIKTETGWKLHVEQKAVDILLDKLPWGFSTIRLPWMEQILNVEWC